MAKTPDEVIFIARKTKETTDDLIRDNEPFIRSRVLKFGHLAPSIERDDLYSIVLLSFYQAVTSFELDKGHFYPFADLVIKRRIIDEVRKIMRQDNEILAFDDEGEDAEESTITRKASMQQFDQTQRQQLLALEISEFTSELKTWGVSFEALTKHSPKRSSLRDAYRKITAAILENKEVLDTIIKKRYFPIKEISRISGETPKKLERARVYIIATIIISTGDYELLPDYLKC